MNRHETDVVSLVFGAVFLAIAGIWLLFKTVHISRPSLVRQPKIVIPGR